jgi:hypothetical protein
MGRKEGFMTGIELLAVTYLVHKLQRVGARVNTDIDKAMDAGLVALESLVFGKLGNDPALAALRREAAEDAVTEQTVRQVREAVAKAADGDAEFAQRLQQLVVVLQSRDLQVGGQTKIVTQNPTVWGNGRVNQAVHNTTGSGHSRVYASAGSLFINRKITVFGNVQISLGALSVIAAVVIAAVALGAAKLHAIPRVSNGASLSQITGTWVHQGFDEGPFHYQSTILRVTADGRFDLRTGSGIISGPGANDPTSYVHIDCGGSASVTADHFDFHPTSGACENFTATLTPDGRQLSISNGQQQESLARQG